MPFEPIFYPINIKAFHLAGNILYVGVNIHNISPGECAAVQGPLHVLVIFLLLLGLGGLLILRGEGEKVLGTMKRNHNNWTRRMAVYPAAACCVTPGGRQVGT